jgi:hypothetical protein
MSTRFVALAVLVAAASIALVVPPALGVAGLVLPVVAVVLGPRLDLDRLGQAVATFAAMFFGVIAPRVLAPGPLTASIHQLSEPAMLMTMPILGAAGIRALFKRARFGTPVTLAAGLVVLTAGGRAISGPTYPLLCATFLGLAFLGMAATDAGRAPWRRTTARHVIAVVLGSIAAAVLTVGATRLLPQMQEAAVQQFLLRYRWARTGFSNQLELGSMRGMLMDDRVVLRVRGSPPPKHLRGAVYTRYWRGQWLAPRDIPVPEVIEVDPSRPDGNAWLELENARRPERYFVPLGAGEVRTSAGFFNRDALNIHRPIGGFDAKRVWFQPSGGRDALAPRWSDRALPKEIVARIRTIVDEWDTRRGAPRERLERIQHRLQTDYTYSLDFERNRAVDPVIDFLDNQRRGHCEYFASAMAVLARGSDVPARVVAGYRVAENSPFGYAVVRQRHAHAWVEAWVDGKWVTYDPTPAAGLAASAPATTPWPSALRDGVATAWEAADDWLAERTPFQLSMALVVLAGGFILARNTRLRRGRRRQAPTRVDRPLPGFVALTSALTRRGLRRSNDETLASYTARIARASQLSEEECQEVTELIGRYADLRYAGRGDAAELEAHLARAARSL